MVRCYHFALESTLAIHNHSCRRHKVSNLVLLLLGRLNVLHYCDRYSLIRIASLVLFMLTSSPGILETTMS